MSRPYTRFRPRLSLLTVGILGLCAQPTAHAEENPSRPSAASDTALQTVVVTGARDSGRTVAKSLAPIDVISADDLARSGKQNLRDALAASVPSYTNAAGFTGGTGLSVKSATLRGLGGNHVLVLVNGKRRHNTSLIFVQTAATSSGQSPADLDLIPIAAVDHVEVLRDGAAAQYGSDAIAGVINIILKTNRSGGSGSALYGQYANRVGGKGNFGARGQGQINQGFELPNDGFFSLSADIGLQESSNVAGAVPDRTSIYFRQNGQPDPRETSESRYRQQLGQPRSQTYNFGYNAELPLNEDYTLYSFSTLSHRNSTSWGTYRTANSPQNIVSVYPDGFSPRFVVEEDDFQSVFGVRNDDLLGWAWDLSSSYGYNNANTRNERSLNPSLGPNSPQDMDGGNLIASQWTNNLDLTRAFDTGLFAKPLNVSTGLEFRRDGFEIQAGEYASYADGGYVFPAGSPLAGQRPNPGAPGLVGFTPADAHNYSRTNTAGYVDFSQSLTDQWDVSLAGRFEHYSDFGDTGSGKFSTRYAFTPQFAVRGTVNNGFRAPSLQQQFYSSSLTAWRTSPLTGQLEQATTRYVTVNDAAGQALGAKELKPERSMNYSLGFVATPTENLDITVDLYQIDIKDRILQTSNLQGTAVSNVLAAQGLNPNQIVSYFGNLADTRTRGIDLVADYRYDLGRYGKTKWTLLSNQSLQTIEKIKEPAALAGTGVSVMGRDRQGNLTSAYPKNTTSLNAAWQLGDFEVNLKETRYSKVTGRNQISASRDEKIRPAFITDLSVGYWLSDAVKVTVGGENIFDRRPQQLNDEAKRFYFFPTDNPTYSWYSPYGLEGAYYFAKVDVSW
ncbi:MULTISPECIES: TonB-dependent receptor plug domain-containing protein [Pseudomonas]|uniref:TonB-dependent receptor plug domain-containing protein n=1 Tax=Pseudomonas TaxID=286 RepID=UPI0011B6BB37|nr:TonB-dependent receptor [Pseudomonas marginalis]KAA8551482.1 Colicin I receptor [Pseudomonas marginalis]NMZ95067.1 TonB-dependent receptor [Pseudomonas marginalis]TWR67906.1 TonB-dependent receptor [Pseudomonas marginalis]